MELDQQNNQQQSLPKPSQRSTITARSVLNVTIGLLLLVVAYFAYAVFSRSAASQKPVETATSVKPEKIIQLDVLNGCGVKGIAAKITNALRAGGFDVVEMRNYKTSHIPKTLVVDRVGNMEAARRVAASLGISERNVIQQINPDYFVDVSLIIGDDYQILRPLQ